MFKYVKGFLNIEKDTLFKTTNVTNPKTRHQHTFMPLTVPCANLDLRKNSFSVRGSRLWNSLPSVVRESNTVNKFKNAYDLYIKRT